MEVRGRSQPPAVLAWPRVWSWAWPCAQALEEFLDAAPESTCSAEKAGQVLGPRQFRDAEASAASSSGEGRGIATRRPLAGAEVR